MESRLNAVGTTLKRLLHACGQRLYGVISSCWGCSSGAQRYEAHRNTYIERVIGNEDLLEGFQENRELPDNFGVRLDERVIEYPWVLAKLRRYRNRSRFLDAGSTLNHEMILRHPLVRKHNWTLLTLSPESKCFWDLGVSYIYDDLRVMPLRDNWFDAVFCISVIEHVGMDNVFYAPNGLHREDRPQDHLIAIREIRRILRPDGWLFLTVPFGRYEDHGWFQQFDSAMLSALIAHFQPQRVQKTFFRYTGHGWKLASEEQCRDLAYFDMSKFSKSSGATHLDPDFAAAARGVACVELQK